MSTALEPRTPSLTGAPPPSAWERRAAVWSRERVDGLAALAVAVSWFVLVQVAAALEPHTTHRVPVLAVVLEVTLWAFLAAMVVGLACRRRWGFVASLGAAVVATAASIACPTTGHHTVGAWWYGQMVCVVALVAVSLWALRRPAVSGGGEPGEQGAAPGA